MTAENPLAPETGRFALAGSNPTPAASPSSMRPWGLRCATPPRRSDRTFPEWTYDPQRQLAVDPTGRPLIELSGRGDPSADTTASVDGEDPPSSEDWIND
ncbi:putative ATP-grasp target RiPP [Tamaricihabitans halophyticus]|uniref:Putative ATP-grasp target RiPP n=1 Tax=Tamaricihabitans halophyticus TaxID=1262583 RepID=A0A4R2R0C1_9PSEU|nr:putative ATP-grasp-modified RiPP [Tamaricihabitans halophyticus]TCP54878.1 putative ATP-grasp target RiPP [Tamaricihabitans halophyticus]